MVKHYLLKSEPGTYGFDQLVADGRTRWDGVRNFEARNTLRAMSRGDLALFYHSGQQRSVVGVATITREAYPDPTAKEGDWSAVDVAPLVPLARPVTLAQLRADPAFEGLLLLTRSRLSVTPLSAEHFQRISELGGVCVPR